MPRFDFNLLEKFHYWIKGVDFEVHVNLHAKIIEHSKTGNCAAIEILVSALKNNKTFNRRLLWCANQQKIYLEHAIHYAAFYNHLDVVEFLVKTLGIDILKYKTHETSLLVGCLPSDNKKLTPIEIAALQGHREMTDLLMNLVNLPEAAVQHIIDLYNGSAERNYWSNLALNLWGKLYELLRNGARLSWGYIFCSRMGGQISRFGYRRYFNHYYNILANLIFSGGGAQKYAVKNLYLNEEPFFSSESSVLTQLQDLALISGGLLAVYQIFKSTQKPARMLEAEKILTLKHCQT